MIKSEKKYLLKTKIIGKKEKRLVEFELNF